jgi:hypothetical protein
MIQLTVLELDNAESAQVKSLLKTLASIGASAYPPASPVLAVLDRVGEQLLKGDTDDTELRYSFVLHPMNSLGDPRYAALAVGNYALVKEEPGACERLLRHPVVDGETRPARGAPGHHRWIGALFRRRGSSRATRSGSCNRS